MISLDCHSIDANPLLPPAWKQEVAGLADGPDLISLIAEDDWQFCVVTGNIVTRRLDWLWRLYHGAFREFASTAFGRDLVPSNRRDATVTLNLLSGFGATNLWHSDTCAVTGVLFATTHEEGQGGTLQFRDEAETVSEIRPIAGHFVCFRGSVEHRVAPLQIDDKRISFPMTFYESADSQAFASPGERYTLPLD